MDILVFKLVTLLLAVVFLLVLFEGIPLWVLHRMAQEEKKAFGNKTLEEYLPKPPSIKKEKP